MDFYARLVCSRHQLKTNSHAFPCTLRQCWYYGAYPCHAMCRGTLSDGLFLAYCGVHLVPPLSWTAKRDAKKVPGANPLLDDSVRKEMNERLQYFLRIGTLSERVMARPELQAVFSHFSRIAVRENPAT